MVSPTSANTPLRALNFSYTFYDGASVRVVSAQPTLLPTRITLYGRSVELLPTIMLSVANFPQILSAQEVTVLVGDQLEAQVVSLQNTATCTAGETADCNRTTVMLQSVSTDSPLSYNVSVYGRGTRIIQFQVDFFTPCNYEFFCGQFLLTADSRALEHVPPSSPECVLEIFGRPVCADANKLPPPRAKTIQPSQGPASGRTSVTIHYSNLPAFVLEDVYVVIGSGANTVRVSVTSLTPKRGSSLLDNTGEILFNTPKVSQKSVLAF